MRGMQSRERRSRAADEALVDQANRLAKKLSLPPLAAIDPAENEKWNGAPLKEAVAELLEWATNELDVRTLNVKPRAEERSEPPRRRDDR